MPATDANLINIYPPHFFQRYKERILKDDSMSNNAVIKHFFEHDWGFMGAVVNEDFESVFHCFEAHNRDEKISFVAAISQGYCFGERQGKANIIKTIISEDMLFDNQRSIFAELKKAFCDSKKKSFGVNL